MPYTLAIPIGPVEAFVLIATRVLAVLATSPIMGLKNVPIQARLGLGLFTALILVPVIASNGLPAGVDVNWTTLAGEAVVGALSGFAATVAYTAISFGASLLDIQAGFQPALGSHLRREVVLMQRIRQPESLLNLLRMRLLERE